MAEFELGNFLGASDLDPRKKRKPTGKRVRHSGASDLDPLKGKTSTSKPKRTGASDLDPRKGKTTSKTKRKADNLEALQREASELLNSMSGIPDEEQQQLDQYVHMFDKLVEIAKILEEKIVTTASSRDVYPLMQTYNQIREVIADMRALRDMGSIGDRVNQEVLYPFVQSAAKDAGEFYQSITRQCKRLLPEEMFVQVDQLLREEFQAYGGKLQASYTAFLDKTATIL